MFSIVCPLSKTNSPNSYDQFMKLGVVSYNKYLDTKTVSKFIIICPKCDIEELRTLKILYPKIPFQFVNEEIFIKNNIECEGWVKQQLIKLKSYTLVDTREYITLDGDLFLVDYLSYNDLFLDGKPKYTSEPFQTINDVNFSVNSKWVYGSCSLLKYDSGYLDGKSIMSVTPQILITHYVKQLIDYLSRKYSNWEQEFIDKNASEYTLYWLFLYNNGLTDAYIDVTTNTLSRPLWFHDLSTNGLVSMSDDELSGVVKNSLSLKKMYFCVIQSWIRQNVDHIVDLMISKYDDSSISSYNEILDELVVFETSLYNKVRVGNSNDGGYVILDIYSENLNCDKHKIDSCYGYGVGNNINFEIDLMNRFNVSNCYLYDHTVSIEGLPANIKYFKEGLSHYKYGDLNTLENQVKNNSQNSPHSKDLFLKMDVEGYEWLSLLSTPNNILERFNQIVLEVHWLETDNNATIDQKLEFFHKMNSLFYLVHIHANNCSNLINLKKGDSLNRITLPNVLELTYVRKDILSMKPYSTIYKSLSKFPTVYDAPNDPMCKDIEFNFYPYNRRYENIVIVCSIINDSPGSVYSSEERINQTINTIKTVREKIPNSYIILAEISNLTQSQRDKLDYDACMIYNEQFNKMGYISGDKTLGELYLINSSLEWVSNNFCTNTPKRIFKIGGRNYLDNTFDINDHKPNFINCKLNPDKRDDVYMTLFSFGYDKLDVLKSIFKTAYYTNGMGKYLENGLYDLISKLSGVNYLDNLGCSGTYSMNGKFYKA